MNPATFSGAIVFAAVAALGLHPSVSLLEGFASPRVATLAYLSLVSATYLGLLHAPRSKRLGGVTVVLLFGAGATLLSDDLARAGTVLALAIAIGRSRFALPERLAHPWFAELCVGGAALVFAGNVLRAGEHDLAIAVWTYFLVQSAYFLLLPVKAAHAPTQDPFDVAVSRAAELMDDA